MVQVFHGNGIFQNLCNLGSSRNKLEHISVILDGSGLVLGRMSHFQRILQHGDQLFDLSIIQHTSGNPALGG